MRLSTSQVRLEAKLETLAEALEAKKKEYSIKEFEVRSSNTIASFLTNLYVCLIQVSQLQSENLQLISYKRQVIIFHQRIPQERRACGP